MTDVTGALLSRQVRREIERFKHPSDSLLSERKEATKV